MDLDKIKDFCKENDIRMTDVAYTHIEQSVKLGKYSYEQVADYIQKKAPEFRQLFEHRELFKPSIEPQEIKNEQQLKAYAESLSIKIPEKTFQDMARSIREGKNSPSQLANYLRGHAYEQFLQSKTVPHISEATHKQIKDNLGEHKYHVYTANLQTVSKKIGLTEPTVHHLAERFTVDKAEALQLYSHTTRNALPSLDTSSAKTVSEYAKRLGVDLSEHQSQILIDSNLSKDEIKKHIAYTSFEQFSKDPERLSHVINSPAKQVEIQKQQTKTKEPELSL